MSEADVRALHQLVDALPADERWTPRKRRQWLLAVERAVDYFIVEVPEAAASEGSD